MKTQPIIQNIKSNIWIYTLITLWIVSALTLWISKKSTVSQVKETFELRMDSLTQNHSMELDSIITNQLKLSMKSISWAIRGELIRGNLEQVEQYIYLLIQNKNITEANLITPENSYWISSNKKNEGSDIIDKEWIKMLNTKELSILQNSEGYVAFAPVMSLDEQLGTVVIKFY